MNRKMSKRVISGYLTVIAMVAVVVLSCLFALSFFTRDTGSVIEEENSGSDDIYTMIDRGYGAATGGIPSGATAIANETDFYNFIAGSSTYGYLTANITLGGKPRSGLILSEGRTLDGNGFSITATHHSQGLSADVADAEGNRDHYIDRYGFIGTSSDAVDIGNSETAYGVSDVISVNYGTIKNLNFVSDANQRVYISSFDGNVAMGGIVGINYGTVTNCTSSFNRGHYGIVGSQWYYERNERHGSIFTGGYYWVFIGGTVSTQNLVAFGGIAGINKGEIYSVKVAQNNVDIGVFFSQYTDGAVVPNDAILSGIVGGVVGLNDGGKLVGVDFYGGNCWLYNDNLHNSVSYTGAVVGLANLLGSAQNYTVNSKQWSVAPGKVQNLTLSYHSSYSIKTTGRGTNGKIGERRTNGYDVSWNTNVPAYGGEIGGMLTVNSSLTERIAVYNTNFGADRQNFGNWVNGNDLGITNSIVANNMPKFGYGTNNSEDYINEITSIQTRFEGQRLEGDQTDLTSMGVTVSYIWDSENVGGVWHSGLRQNVNFTAIGFSETNHVVYGATSYINGSKTYLCGSDDYRASGMPFGGLAVLSDNASSSITYEYSYRMQNIASASEFDAFAGVKTNINYACAYANALVLTQNNTISGLNPSASRIMPSWKTIDGNGYNLTLSGVSGTFEDGGAQITLGTATLTGVSDFVSLNYGTIKNIGFATTGTRTLSVSKNVAFGGAVGINLGTMSQVGYNFHNGGNSSSEINGSGTASAVVAGAVTGVNAGMMSDIKSIIWQNFGVAGAASFAATGGVVGVNHGAGTLKTVVADGVADATLYARGAGNNYLGGVLGFGANYGVLTDESGFAANSTVTGNSPFDNWMFAGKQILDTDNAYVGMLAGAAANSPELAQNGDLAIKGMVAMMPQSTHQTGWFTPQKGNMSLLGRMNGAASAAGYVASDLVYGYSIVAADSSTAYVSKLTNDYNAGKSANGVDAYFSIDANLKNSINIYSKTVEVLYVNTSRTVVETQGDPGNYDNVYFWGDTSLRIPASLEREDAAIVGENNPENYAPTVALHYYYEINLDQALSNADTAGGDRDALWFFLSGDSSQLKKAGTYKALAAGAARGVLTSDWTLDGTNAIVFTKDGGLDGAGRTVTFENANYETVLYDGYDVTGQIAAVNKSTINNVNVVINTSLTVNSANDIVYGGIAGINEGIIGGSTLTVNGTVNIVSQGAGNKFAGGIAGINRGDANSLTVTYAQDAGITLSNEGTGAGALGGYIGWQNSASEDGQTGHVLSDVRVDGYRAALTVNGNGVVGGIVGAVNTGAANSIKIAGVSEQSAKTVLQNVFLTVADIRLSAQSGYKGIISGTAADGNVAEGAMDNVVALYPVQSGIDMPWTSQGVDSYSMYGYNEGDCGANAKGLLIKIRDYSNDENAEYLGTQTLSYDASNLYYSYSFVPTGNDNIESRTTTYYSHDSDPSVLDKGVWSANKLTLPLSYVANGEKVPTADVLLAYSVVLYQGYEDRLVQFMSGQGDIQNGFYAGAYKASVNTGVSFALGANTDRGETSSKGKILNGNGAVVTLHAGSATATVAQDGFNALGYFFSVNNMTVNNLSFVTDGEITANSENVAFGTIFGINNGTLKNISLSIGAAVSVTASGDSNKFVGGAVGINKGEFVSSIDNNKKSSSSVSVRYDADVYVNNTGAGLAVYGGVTGWHNTVNPLHAVAVSGYNRTFSVTGAGAAGGIVGVINTGNTDSLAGGIVETSAKSSLKNVANAIYGLTLDAQYKGLISACAAEGAVRDGAIQNVVAQYTEAAIDKSADGVLEKYTLPWFAASQEYSMYGYNTATGAKASGVLLKISDYSDNEAAEYVGERAIDMNVYGENVKVRYSFAQSDFDGALSVVFEVSYITVENGVVTGAGIPAGTVTSEDGRYTLAVASDKMNGSGDYVPVLEAAATYSVNISQGTESGWNDPAGMTTSELVCFIDGREPSSDVALDAALRKRLQLVAGAQTGTLSQNILFDKPMNAYVTMREEKILDGNGFSLSLTWTGGADGNMITDKNNRDNHDDITDYGSADYEQITVNGESTGAAGGLIAVNHGIVRNLTVNHGGRDHYSFIARARGAFGVLIGANFGTVSNVTYNSDVKSFVRMTAQSGAEDISFGAIAGYNAGTIENSTVNKSVSMQILGEAANAYLGAVAGHNEGTVRRCTTNIGQDMLFVQRIVNLSALCSDTLSASQVAAYGATVGYNEGTADQITVVANVNFGVIADRQANVAAGAAVGINDGGSISYAYVYGWGGFLVRASVIRSSLVNTFVGGIVGAMNADGASALGKIQLVNNSGEGKKASISDSVFALSGGIVTEDGNNAGFARYGYVSGMYAENAAAANKARNVFWFIPDKLQNPEAGEDGTPASEVLVFHTGNATDLTYISVFGKKPSDEFTDVATNSYGYTFVDIDDNPLNIFVMTPSLSAGTLSISVRKADGFYRKAPVARISGADSSTIVATADEQGNVLTLRNNGNATGYVTFSYEDAEVYAVTDFTYEGKSVDAQFMIISFLSGSPSGSTDGNNIDYFDYTTVDGENSKSLRDSAHRAFQLWSGASFLTLSGQNKTVNLSASINDKALILSEGKTFDGGQASGYSISITGDFSNNIAEISLGYENGVEQRYLVVSEFLAINYGTFSNATIKLTANDAAGKVISRTARDVLQRAQAKGIDTKGITGFVYGMMVGVNAGKIKDFGDYVFDRKITLESNNSGASVNSVFGGMVGIQTGEQSEISNVGNITFGSETDPGSITMTGTAKKISAGGLVGVVLGGKIENLSVTLKTGSSIEIIASHDSAAMGGIVGDLRGTLRQVDFDSEYQSRMLINYTKDKGAAALGGLVGVINSQETGNASIEQVTVEGNGYIYNGLNENGVVTTNSIRLYTSAVVALGSNYGVLDSSSEDSAVKELVAAYGTIRPSVLDRIYVDFRGYVRAKNNSQVGIVTARYLDGITQQNIDINTTNLSNIVWRTSYTQSTLWTTAKNYADNTETFDTNTNVAVFGKAAVTLDDSANNVQIRGVGFKLWPTNNLYNATTNVAGFNVEWKLNEGLEVPEIQLQISIVSAMGYNSISRYTAYYNPDGTDGATKYPQIANYGDVQKDSSSEFFIDTAKAAEDIKQSAAVFSSGIYIIRITYNEVYIHNQKEFATFASNGLFKDEEICDVSYNQNGVTYDALVNANIGIIANDFTISWTRGASRLTLPADKIIEGNGNTITLEPQANDQYVSVNSDGSYNLKSGRVTSDTVEGGVLMPGETFLDYIGGRNVYTDSDLALFRTVSDVGITVGGLFIGRNLGTIQNLNFQINKSYTINNIHYVSYVSKEPVGGPTITGDYALGTAHITGIVSAVNAGTIDNCTVNVADFAQLYGLRESCNGYFWYKGYTNELHYKVNTMSTIGGFAGMTYGTDAKPSVISNCSINLGFGGTLAAQSNASTFSWVGRDDNVTSYAGGIVGWLTNNSRVYNATISGSGEIRAWADLKDSEGIKVTAAGGIVGLNSSISHFTTTSNTDEYGDIDGVICNWNGVVRYATGSGNTNYYPAGKQNYGVGAQMIGVSEKSSLHNIYFMYGEEEYKSFHRDNWYYGTDTYSRYNNPEFKEKYDYIKQQAKWILENGKGGYDELYIITGNVDNADGTQRNSDGSPSQVSITQIAAKNGDVVTLNENFTLLGLARYHTADDINIFSGFGCGQSFAVYGFKRSENKFYNALSYFPRIAEPSGNKNNDWVGARSSGMLTDSGNLITTPFKANNVYIYEIPFGTAVTQDIEGHGGNQLDLNDPDTQASLTFQTKNINSDVSIDIQLNSTSMGAQFIWELYEDWLYLDGTTLSDKLVYYDAITSLEQAHNNNKYAKTFERENEGTDFYISYVLGMAIKVAMSQEDADNYVFDDESGIYYDKYAKVYDGQTVYDPTMVYIDENGNPIDWEGLGLQSLKPFKVSQLNTPKTQYVLLEEDGSETRLSSYNETNRRAGVYVSRIQFKSEEGENYQINTSNRTIMFSDHEKIDIYSVILPKDLRSAGTDISVSKTYDGTTLYDNTQKKNYSTVTISASKRVNGDDIDLKGEYNDATVAGCDGFVAQFRDFTFRYVDETGAIQTAVIKVFDGSLKAGNYTLVKSYVNANGRFILSSALADKYYQSTDNMSVSQRTVNATIRTKGIAVDDLELYMYGDNRFVGGSSNESADYNAALVYNTDSFTKNSKILGKYVVYKDGYLQVDGYMSGEKINFYITFTKEGSSQILTSVKDYGTYKVYFNIVESQNFTLGEDGAAVEPYYIGNLIISQYHIQTADIKYVIAEGELSKVFDNTDALLSLLNGNLRMYDQNGQLITDAVAQVGVAYAVSDSGSGTSYSDRISAVNSGRYRLYFTIKSFETGNYVLDKMDGFSFCDSSGNVIEFYYITPKEIRFEAVTKEFDNTVVATDKTVYEYEEGFAPFTVSGNATIFDLEFSDPDVAANMSVKATTSVVSMAGKNYNVLTVKSGEGKGLQNYYIASVSANDCRFGNITPVTVEVESVSMMYNGKTPVNYKEGAQITINRKSTGEKIDIYPEAYFNTKSAGENKTVTFEVDRVTINGTEYMLLKNAPSSLVSGSLPETGKLWAHNYAVEKNTFSPASIIKNTLSIDDIRGNITVAYSRNSSVAKSADFDKIVSSAIFTQYRYEYQLVATVSKNATIATGEKLEEHVSVSVTHNMDYTNGFAGGYTVQLILSEDFDWDESMYESAQKDNTFKVVVIEEQTVSVNNLSVKDGTLNEVYPYIQTPRTLSPVLVVRDMDGHTFEPIPQWSKLTNYTAAFAGSYSNGSKLPVGDYRFVLTPDLSNGNYDYVINYKFSGGGISNTFSVTPRNVTFTVSKEFDNSDSFTTSGNEAKFSFTAAPYDYDSDALPGRFANKEPGKNKTVYIDVEEVTVNGTVYYLINDSKGKASNNCVTATGTMVNGQVPAGTRGEIKKYSLSPAEITAYINGWIKDSVTKVNGVLKDRQLEYREGAEAGYAATDFTFAFAGRYNMRADAAYMPEVRQGASSVTTLSFEITLTCGSQTYSYAINDEQLFALPVGEYTVSLNLSNAYFDLPANALAGKFIVAKQEVGGGDGATDNNIFIVLTGDFSHVYGESGFNLPTVDDSAFAYTLQIIDKYTGKVGATFDKDAFGTLRYSLAPDGEKVTVLDETIVANGVFVGGYYVWATDFSEELGNYMISTELEIPVYIAGTPTPSVPQSEPPEEGGEEGEEGGETGGLPQVPDTPLTQSYFVLPAPLTFDEIRKTYDGTTDITEQTTAVIKINGIVAGDNVTVQMINGAFEQPDATHDSEGNRLKNGLSPNVKIAINQITLKDIVYNTLAAQGLLANYCMAGEVTTDAQLGNVVITDTGMILRKIIDASTVTLESDTFESVYGEGSYVLPQIYANIDGRQEAVTPQSVMFRQGGEEVANPVNVGGYELYAYGIAFDNYETGELGGLLVNSARAATNPDEGGESGGEEGGEPVEPEIKEVYTYYIVPKEIVITGVSKFYDASAELTYPAEGEEGLFAKVSVTDNKEGNPVNDGEGELVLRLQGRMSDALAGKAKDVLADFVLFGYYENFTDVAKQYYRLVVLAEDGTAVAGNYCIAAAEGEAELPVQFDPDYVPKDPQNDDTPVLNNGIVYNMTLFGKGTVIPRPLTAEGVVKTYDGNADITTGTLTGWLEQDAASLADWRYDSKDAGVRDIWVNTDGDDYVYDDGETQTTYYAIYVKGEDGSLILSNYSVAAAGLQTVEIPPTEEGGQPTKVTYAVISGAGKINKYALGTQNVDGVRVGNTVLPASVEYNGTYYDNDSVWAKISVLGMSAAYTKASGGTITFVLANGDEIVLRVSLNGGTRFKDAGQYPLTLTLEENTNYTMSAYSATFTISRQELTYVYVITGGHISKYYDALPDMPGYAKDGWVIAARDKQGNYIDGATLGEIDLAGANIVFTRFNEEEQKYENYIPVNAGTYPVEVKGFEINATNYVFTQDMTAFGYVSYNFEESKGERANYIINPYKLNISSALAQSEKKFDGSYSLRMSGAAGETVVIRDAAGNNYSLAGSYTDIPFVPEVANVLIGKDALNEQSVVTNYAVYNGSEQVTGQVTIAQLTVTPSDVLVAERDGNSYGVGISGLQGLDFVFANSSLDVDAKKLILNKAESGQQLSDGEKAAFAEALASVLTVYLNNGTEAVTVNGIKGFTYTEQQNSYVFAFAFSGADNHDSLTATDRYTLAVKGSGSGQDGQNYALSTNAMATSSHLASGQVYAQTSGSVTTAEELKEKIKNNQDISLANSIYGVDLSDVSATAYSATFEGNGHTLGITGSLSDKETESSKGWLFAVNNGTIRNLSVVIMPDGASAGATNTGFIGKNNGTVQNVSVRLMTDWAVSGAAYVGGIAGENGAGATIEQSDFVIGADIDVQGAVFGAVSANSQGTLSGVAVRTDDATYGGEDYRTFTVNAASATVTGQGSPAVNGVIIAVEAGRVNGFTVSVIDGATNVYSYQDYQGANGGQLSLLTPYTTGYIGYYFVGQQEYAGAFDDNMLNAKGEVNKSSYRDYTVQSGYVAVEAIASYGRFVWDGYGINYKTPLGESVVGSALNRVVAIFAEGDISSQFESTATVTNGVDAFTVALGIRGGNVEIEGGASVSTKEVIYNGNTQEYKVTVTVNGVQKEIMVAGKDAGYYTKAILEGLLPGDGETIGDVTYDSGSRTEYVFTGGATATNGIALIIYPKQTSADDVTAQKYYDSASDATVTLKDGQKDVASVNGIYYDDSANVTADVLEARKAGVINFANVTRSVLVKDGIFYAVVQNVEMTETGAVTTYTTQQITYTATVDGKLTQVPFTTQTTIDETGISEFMRAYARLTDRAYAEQYLDESTLQEYEFVTVYNVTAFVTVTQGENGKSTASFSQPVYAPVLSGINGENASNYALYGSDWTFDRNTILASAQYEQQINALQPVYTVNGVILPVDLGLQAQYTRGRDQSYNDAMILPEASLKDGAVGSMITAEQAQQKYGITAEQYAVIVNALTENGITLSGSADEIFADLVQSGVLKSENGNYYTVNKQYATDSELPAKLNAGNFIVSFADGERNVAFRYFGIVHSDGNVYYELTSESDYAMWADNERGKADYYAIDMLLTNDIDFGGKECAMLAWRDGEGNVVGYQGTFDGDGYAMRGMLIARQASAALFERIDETGVVRNLTVADSIVIATGDNASAAGIAVDNYGSIQNCAYEGIVSAGGESSKTVNAGGIAAANYGSVTDAVSVNRTYVSAADGAAVTIEGIAADKQGGSTEDSISLQENDNLVAGAREQSTVIESNGEASDYAHIKDDETVTAVISAYVFDERYIKVDTDGKFVTDNFFKLNAVDILFGWIGAEAVTHPVQNGFYGQITLG